MVGSLQLVLTSVLSITAVLTTPTRRSANESTESFGILLDAGSSSTKLKIYRWTPPASPAGVPTIAPVSLAKTRFKPGLASFEGDLPGMTTYLSSIIDEAKKTIPSGSQASTPIYVLATAGFRLLGLADAKTGMEEVETILSNSSINPFMYRSGGASVLSGEEEGVYAWLAANYLLGFFNSTQPAENAVGILEMGGGSTQIVFIPRQPLVAEEFQVTMGGRRYSLYVQSYLRYGATEVKEKVVESLLVDPAMTGVDNPCMLAGDAINITLNDGRTVLSTGTGQPEACREIFRALLASVPPEECNMPPCAIGSVFQPNVSGIDFYATQAFTYPLRGVGAVDSNNVVLDLQGLWNKTKTYCEKNISEFPAGDRKYASGDCSGAVYIDTLLSGPYGFPRDTNHIRVTSKVNDDDIDWALGAMLELLSMTFSNDPEQCSVTRR